MWLFRNLIFFIKRSQNNLKTRLTIREKVLKFFEARFCRLYNAVTWQFTLRKGPFPLQKTPRKQLISMGRRSKAAAARLNNLGQLKNSRNPTVENVSEEMELNVKNALDDVPLLQIQRWASSPRKWMCELYLSHLIRYANRAARFISAYVQGLSGPEAAWANRKYHGHRTIWLQSWKLSTKKSTVHQ